MTEILELKFAEWKLVANMIKITNGWTTSGEKSEILGNSWKLENPKTNRYDSKWWYFLLLWNRNSRLTNAKSFLTYGAINSNLVFLNFLDFELKLHCKFTFCNIFIFLETFIYKSFGNNSFNATIFPVSAKGGAFLAAFEVTSNIINSSLNKLTSEINLEVEKLLDELMGLCSYYRVKGVNDVASDRKCEVLKVFYFCFLWY